MALRTLYPVRLADGCSSGGFQIILLQEKDMERLWHALPEFIRQMEAWQKEDFPAGSAAVEWFAAGMPDDLEHRTRTGLHVRFRLPGTFGADLIDALCRREAEKAVPWLLNRGIHCDLPGVDEEGTVWLYPSDENACIRYFVKERRLEKHDEGPVCVFSPFHAAAPIRLREIASILRESGGRGLSLHILPGMKGFEKQKARAMETLNRWSGDGFRADEESMRWGTALTVWGADRADADRFADRLLRILRTSGVFLAARSPRPAGYERVLQMVYDPWALFDGYLRQIEIELAAKLAALAVSLSQEEIDGLYQVGESAPAVSEEASSAETEDGQITERVREVGDTQLSLLAEKLKQHLTIDQFLTVAAEMMARLDALMGKENELDSRMERLNAIIGVQKVIFMKRLDALEASVNETTTREADRVLDGMGANLESVMERIAALPDDLAGAFSAANALAAAVPPQMDIGLTEEEMEALGISREEELAEQGMTDEEIRLLRIALTLARMGLKQTEDDFQYMPFTAPLGCLYEMMVRNSFDKRITEADIENRRSEYEERQSSAVYPDRKAPPKTKDETELSFYDYVSRRRVVEGFFKHVTMDGEKLQNPMEWNIWFSCFKFVRGVRNKVHSGCGSVSREELELMVRLLLLPGPEHKWNAINYRYSHPYRRANGTMDGSLNIRHYEDGKTAWNCQQEMKQYLARFGNERFRESLIRFLIRVRNTAEWQEE